LRGLRCGQNADGCEARDEGRSVNYEAEERNDADVAFYRNPKGQRLSVRSALSLGLPRDPAIGCTSLRASHPGKPLSHARGT
ncbi:MAG TPA: hypothetical protein VEG37_04015, partial [Burkholderiales bacterium]|nr:hypothetical protein [Burkholderiales bacterium]